MRIYIQEPWAGFSLISLENLSVNHTFVAKMTKKVIVIGAGVAGLSAAIYSRRAGYSVTVYEKGNCPGGVSTSWVRQGYTFDGGLHWLVGSSSRFQPFHKRWQETGALQENNPVIYSDPFLYSSQVTFLYVSGAT